MFLTKADLAKLPDSAFSSTHALILAVVAAYACGITDETAALILSDYRAGNIRG